MNERWSHIVAFCFLLLFGGTAWLQAADSPGTAVIQTVTGIIPAAELGWTLPHEHVLVDFVGAKNSGPHRYDADAVFEVVRPHLQRAAERGVRALFECTPAFLARDPVLLRRLSVASNVRLITNTGLYGAANDKFLPAYAFSDTAEQLADRWIAEFQNGIADTGIKPGFIKCGVDAGAQLSDVDRKLVEAAALTHHATGLTIAVHTGSGPGVEEIEILRAHGVTAEAFVWVHAQNAPDDVLIKAADAGAWLSFDGLQPSTASRHLALCRLFRDRGQLGQILLSHDAGWYDPAKPGGGVFRDYEFVFTVFLPLLQQNGFTEAEIERLFVENPARAFAIRPRLSVARESARISTNQNEKAK